MKAGPSEKHKIWSKPVNDGDYSVNLLGIGKKAFQIIYKYEV